MYDNIKYLCDAGQKLNGIVEDKTLEVIDLWNLQCAMMNWCASFSCSSNTQYLETIKKDTVALVQVRDDAEDLYFRIRKVLRKFSHQDTLVELAMSSVIKYSFLSVDDLPVTIIKKLKNWSTVNAFKKRHQLHEIMLLRLEVGYKWGIGF